MPAENGSFSYTPELLSRRGEFFAWLTAFLMTLAWILLRLVGVPVAWVVPTMTILLFFIAASISLGNWMDRRTNLRIVETGVHFENGLRLVDLAWNEITQMEVFPSSWGKKVRVYGEKGHFDFRTLGEFKIQGEVKGRMGFADGEAILQMLLSRSHLVQVERSGSGYYYVRQ